MLPVWAAIGALASVSGPADGRGQARVRRGRATPSSAEATPDDSLPPSCRPTY